MNKDPYKELSKNWADFKRAFRESMTPLLEFFYARKWERIILYAALIITIVAGILEKR